MQHDMYLSSLIMPILAIEAQYPPILVNLFVNIPFLTLETRPQSLLIRIPAGVTLHSTLGFTLPVTVLPDLAPKVTKSVITG